LLEIAGEGSEKLVVIGHSRGACDALAFALANPAFVADHVQALFLVQGPFGGTGAADYVVGEGPPIDSQMPWRHRVIARALGGIEVFLMGRGKHGGIKALTTRSSELFWERAMEQHRAAVPIVGPKTFYVTTRTEASRLQIVQQAIARYLSYLGPNDGMVALEDQTVPGLGTVVAILDAGHTDLTHRFPTARPNRRLRRALIDAIVMAVGGMPSCS
jgi:pimeloyl-ACP methyl ester carboxylesterase